MAVVTTVATSPLLDMVKPDPWLGETPGPDRRADIDGAGGVSKPPEG